MEHSGDPTRAFLFTLIMLVMIQMDCVKSDTEVEVIECSVQFFSKSQNVNFGSGILIISA